MSERIYGIDGGRVENGEHGRTIAIQRLLPLLEADLRQRGLIPQRAPELPVACELAEVIGPYRLLVAFQMCPVEGIEYDDDGSTPKRDEEGELMYICGPPGLFVRVDTIVEE